MKTVLLQCKFFLVAYLNFSYMFFPNPLRNYYLRLFGIKIDKGKLYSSLLQFFSCWQIYDGTEFCGKFRMLFR